MCLELLVGATEQGHGQIPALLVHQMYLQCWYSLLDFDRVDDNVSRRARVIRGLLQLTL